MPRETEKETAMLLQLVHIKTKLEHLTMTHDCYKIALSEIANGTQFPILVAIKALGTGV